MNIQKLQAKLNERGLDAIVLFSRVNIQYLAKFAIDDGAAVITRDRAWMFTDSRYIEAAKKNVDCMTVEQFDRARPMSVCLKQALEGCAFSRTDMQEALAALPIQPAIRKDLSRMLAEQEI